MKSRRDGIFILCIVFIAAVLAGCGAAEQRPVLGKIEYTNLNDSGSRTQENLISVLCQERRKKRFLIHGRKKNAEIQQKHK